MLPINVRKREPEETTFRPTTFVGERGFASLKLNFVARPDAVVPIIQGPMNAFRSQPATHRVRDLFVVLVGAAVLWLAFDAGLMQSFDDWCYDRVAPLVSRPVSEQPVLLVYADQVECYQDPTRLQQVIDELFRLGAGQVGLTFPTHGLELNVPNRGEGAGRVIVPEDGIDITLLGQGSGGCRDHSIKCAAGKLSLEAVMARHAGISCGSDQATPRSFRVWFAGRSESLPQVSDNELLGGLLIDELVANKSILIGWTPQPGEPRLATPSSMQGSMTDLEFRGHALNTLLTHRVVQTPARWVCFSCIVLAALLGFIASQLSWRRLPAIAVVAFVLAGGVGWVFLSMRQLWIPIAPLTAAFLLSAWCVATRRAFLIDGRSERISNAPHTNSNLGSLSSVCDSSTSFGWPDAAALLDNVIEVDRVAVLMCRQGMRLEMVHLRDCDHRDISQRHRRSNASQPIFQDAIDAGEAIRLEGDFFFVPQDDESQFVIPLFQFGHEVGFLVVGLSAYRAAQEPGLLARMSQVGSGLSRIVSEEGGSTAKAPVTIDAFAEFDLKGDLRTMDRAMLHGLQRCGVPFDRPESSTLMFLLCDLTNTTERDAWQIIADVIFEEIDFSMLASTDGGLDFQIQIQPVKSGADDAPVNAIRLRIADWGGDERGGFRGACADFDAALNGMPPETREDVSIEPAFELRGTQ